MHAQEWIHLAICVVTAIVQCKSAADGCVCNLIIALPNHHGRESAPSWERRVDILPGAKVTKEKINNISECQLELIEVNISHCGADNNFILHEQLLPNPNQHLINFSKQCLGVVGLSCNDIFQVFISSPSIRRSLKRAATTFYLPNQVKPATTPLIRALFKFMKSLNWQKLGIITETGNSYFSRTAEALYSETKNDSSVNIVTYRQLQVNDRVRLVQNVSKITLVSTSLEITVEILCSAYEEKAVWPKYVWILHSYLLDDIKSFSSTRCSISKALENVLFIRQQISESVINGTHDDFGSKYQPQKYSVVLHNLVWTTALKLLNLSIPEKHSTDVHNVIEVTQVRNATEIPIVEIKGSNIIYTDDEIKAVVISDDFQMQFEGASTGYTIIFSIEIVLGFVFVTIMLIGYIYFRNEPEVKSTSFMLSLLIFLGCYLNLFFLIFLLYFHQPILIPEDTLNIICGIFPWISGLGISIALIIATVLVKLARVYHIFSRIIAKPLGKQSSDVFLAGYVLLLLLPMIVILMIWMIFDRFKITYQPSSQIGFIQKQCLSDHLTIWLPLLVLYVVSLFVILVTVAIRSRKIRQKNFKDTKKVNMFIFCLFFDILLPLSFWWLLENLGTSVPYYIAAIPLHLGHIGIILLCQLLLITPKLVTPLSRCLKST